MPRVGPRSRTAPLFLLFLSGLFFLSGVSALIYQVLWMRLLALVFGVTIHAASTVLAAFMAGLAIGSLWAGRIADRTPKPLVLFAGVEAGVAAAALVTPLALAGIELAYVRLNGLVDLSPVALAFVRFLLSSVVLMIPATLMGATLPLVVKSTLASGAILGRQVSLLYGANTAGAVCGTIAAGLWMVPQLGIAWSFRIGAALNLMVAIVALVVHRRSQAMVAVAAAAPADPAVPAGASPEQPRVRDLVRRLVLLTFAVSGFVSFALEILWFRMLVVLFRPTTYAFTVMLATVLAGIAVGSWLSVPLTGGRRRGHLVGTLAVLELLLALTAVSSMWVIGHANDVYMWAAPFFAKTSASYVAPLAVTSVVAILPPALLMGMAFPVGMALWTDSAASDRTGERIGLIYAVNVAGAVAGSLATGFILLPAIGSRASMLLVAGSALVTGLLLATQLASRAAGLALGLSAAAAFAYVGATTVNPIDALLKSRFPREQSVWRQEDGHASVAILRRSSRFSPTVHGIYINGSHQANDTPTMVGYHRMIGTLPAAIHSDPRRALVIGAGGGATAGAVAAFSDQLAVDVVELSGAVAAAARQFSSVNQDLFTRPNVRVAIDDGRNHMLLTPERYDIVTADVILPTHAGAGNLYSVEYYRLMRRVLNRYGIAVQWLGSTGETEYKLLMRTFVTVFPHTTLWQDGSLMVGSVRPLVLEEAAFLKKQASPQSKAALDAMGFTSFDALLARYNAGPREIQAFLGEGPILTDDRPLTEYFLSLPQNDRPVDFSTLRGDVGRHVVRAQRSGPSTSRSGM